MTKFNITTGSTASELLTVDSKSEGHCMESDYPRNDQDSQDLLPGSDRHQIMD